VLAFSLFIHTGISVGSEVSHKNPVPCGIFQLQGERPHQEDRFRASQKKSMSIFAVYDGHGGTEACDYLVRGEKRRPGLVDRIGNKLNINTRIASQLETIFLDFDKKMIKNFVTHNEYKYPKKLAGSTATIAILLSQYVYIANTGDSRTLIIYNNGRYSATKDHKPGNAEEKQRIYAMGGTVKNNRINGKLGVARSFGDLTTNNTKLCGLTAKPDMYAHKRENIQAIVLASDGVWDMLSNKDVAQKVKHAIRLQQNCQKTAREIIAKAMSHTTHRKKDNMTALVINMQKK
jgi:serine/threonine protein phosphatase PrpC